MKPRLKMRLGDLLVQESIITEEQLQQALGEQRKTGHKLGRTLIDLRSITETQLLQFLSQQLNLPLLDISKRSIPSEVVNLIPEVQARRFRALAVEDRGDSVLVAMSDPADLQALDHLETIIAPKKLSVAVAPEQQLLQAFDNLYRRTDQIAQIAGKLEEEYAADKMFDLASLTSSDSDNETTVVKLLQSIFEDAVQMRASDIHIEPGEKVLRIRQRIDGQLHETILNEVNIAAALVLRLKLMAGLDISEKRLPQDGRFHMEIKGHKIDVRMSTMPIYHGESVVMRLLDQSAGLLTLNETGMPPHILARIRKQIKRPHGMLLVTGPTGSGKTTTLYGILSELNTADRKIITVEDPVEYQLPRINQVQVNHKIGLDFSNVLRTTLRQDPDIIMVGEMRDQETVEIGLRGALTGHFVLSTLHTNDAVTSALRLLDMGAASYLVASALRVIIAQRLVRRVCHNCGVEHQPTAQEKAWLNSVSRQDFTHANFRIGTGCQSCNGSGYRGRIGIFEILELDEKMIDAMRTGNPQDFACAALQSPNFTPLAESALQYLSEGMTTIEEVAKLVEDVSESQVPLSRDIISQQGVEA
ncbi:Flp pilus assembly complex ATPase component TadA [Shewanella oneidensis MR-1]|uniref:MSHA pilus assembly ATPase MshE n=1 Tax=Shewanella oneidensis (strain ATCC 700550 / JCM 31522 / CIP 106686 / LMG 19005 / NCIMB 14063 / MR-1) TaxID=211586 RepID=Q8EA00_SHEON|nr:GspE/PulE family protein [Shewanella oneidensis]AAN57083.1 MSHA pilus assembly ATPase MshE [Shewanella oneidensis MR-1]MDX5998587.1 ATPase, T2SS/T4P/T4SS family [Shewanella oneidensis]MEE2026616.1 putative type II secretion system protein HxcR [Shewanella oneidensis]QKG98360.1 Flp pilus assembly complex ATPase component TadA [Shewanella oneidensis MR-1]